MDDLVKEKENDNGLGSADLLGERDTSIPAIGPIWEALFRSRSVSFSEQDQIAQEVWQQEQREQVHGTREQQWAQEQREEERREQEQIAQEVWQQEQREQIHRERREEEERVHRERREEEERVQRISKYLYAFVFPELNLTDALDHEQFKKDSLAQQKSGRIVILPFKLSDKDKEALQDLSVTSSPEYATIVWDFIKGGFAIQGTAAEARAAAEKGSGEAVIDQMVDLVDLVIEVGVDSGVAIGNVAIDVTTAVAKGVGDATTDLGKTVSIPLKATQNWILDLIWAWLVDPLKGSILILAGVAGGGGIFYLIRNRSIEREGQSERKRTRKRGREEEK